MEEKIRKLYNDSSFTAELVAARTFEDASALFERNGVNISAEKLEKIAAEALGNEGEVLSEDMLDNVSGGGILVALGCIAGGYALGRIIAAVTSP